MYMVSSTGRSNERTSSFSDSQRLMLPFEGWTEFSKGPRDLCPRPDFKPLCRLQAFEGYFTAMNYQRMRCSTDAAPPAPSAPGSPPGVFAARPIHSRFCRISLRICISLKAKLLSYSVSVLWRIKPPAMYDYLLLSFYGNNRMNDDALHLYLFKDFMLQKLITI